MNADESPVYCFICDVRMVWVEEWHYYECPRCQRRKVL